MPNASDDTAKSPAPPDGARFLIAPTRLLRHNVSPSLVNVVVAGANKGSAMTQLPPVRQRPPLRVALLGLALILTLAAGVLAWSQQWVEPEKIRQLVAESGRSGMVVFVALVVVLELLWLPRSWGLVTAGVLFGPWAGGLLCFLADTLSAIVCYGLARYAGRSWVEGMVQRHERADRILSVFRGGGRGTVSVMVVRLLPFAHYTLVSYLTGVVGVRWSSFLVGNSLGLLPGTLILPYLGHAALDPTSPRFLAALALGGVAALAGILLARRVLKS